MFATTLLTKCPWEKEKQAKVTVALPKGNFTRITPGII